MVTALDAQAAARRPSLTVIDTRRTTPGGCAQQAQSVETNDDRGALVTGDSQRRGQVAGTSATHPAIAVNDRIPATTAPAHNASTAATG